MVRFARSILLLTGGAHTFRNTTMSGTSITPGSSSAGRDERQRIVDQTGQRSEPLDPAKASSSSNLGRFKALALAEGKKRIEQQRSDELLSSDAIIGTFAEALRSAVEDRHREVHVVHLGSILVLRCRADRSSRLGTF